MTAAPLRSVRAPIAGMRLLAPTLTDLMILVGEARPDEIEQYEAILGVAWDRDTIAVDHYQRHGVKFVLVDDGGDPVCAGGWDIVGPDVWQSWMVGTMSHWDRHWRAITKASRLVMSGLFDQGARRLQTNALASRTAACHWYERGLLMRPEGVMRGYGVNGEDVAMFARLRPASGSENG